MKNIAVMVRWFLKDAFASRRIQSVALIVVLLGGVTLYVQWQEGALSGSVDRAVNVWAGTVEGLGYWSGILVALGLGAGWLPQGIRSGRLAAVVLQPVPRAAVLVSAWVVMVTLGCALPILGAFAVVLGGAAFGASGATLLGVLRAAALIVTCVMTLIAFGLFLSLWARHVTAAGLLFGLLILFGFLGSFTRGTQGWFLAVVAYVYPPLVPPSQGPVGSFFLSFLAYYLSLTTLLLTGACLRFETVELPVRGG